MSPQQIGDEVLCYVIVAYDEEPLNEITIAGDSEVKIAPGPSSSSTSEVPPQPSGDSAPVAPLEVAEVVGAKETAPRDRSRHVC